MKRENIELEESTEHLEEDLWGDVRESVDWPDSWIIASALFVAALVVVPAIYWAL